MIDKRTPLTSEEPKYRKKSQNKGLSRSKHKHIYETVLLYRYYHFTDTRTGRERVTENCHPTKICSICNRIDYQDDDPSYYEYVPIENHPSWREKILTEKALALPKYYIKDFGDKFAIKMEENDSEN